MKNFIFKTYLEILKKEFPFYIVHLLILLILNTIGEILFFDVNLIYEKYGSFNNIPTKTYDVLNTLYGNALMGLQGYLFGFAFFVLFYVIYLIYTLKISKDLFKHEISLLILKTNRFTTSNGLYFIVSSLNYLLLIFLSYALLPLVNYIGNTILNIDLNIFIFSNSLIIVSIVLYIFTVVITLLNYTIPFKNNKIIKYIREIF